VAKIVERATPVQRSVTDRRNERSGEVPRGAENLPESQLAQRCRRRSTTTCNGDELRDKNDLWARSKTSQGLASYRRQRRSAAHADLEAQLRAAWPGRASSW
jgi:hypothetical protein